MPEPDLAYSHYQRRGDHGRGCFDFASQDERVVAGLDACQPLRWLYWRGRISAERPGRKVFTSGWGASSPSSARGGSLQRRQLVKHPIVGEQSENPQLREWHTKNLGRLPGLQVHADAVGLRSSGGPFKFVGHQDRRRLPLALRTSHRDLRISPANSTRSQRNSGGSWTSSRCRSKRSDQHRVQPSTANKDEVTASATAVDAVSPQAIAIAGTDTGRDVGDTHPFCGANLATSECVSPA